MLSAATSAKSYSFFKFFSSSDCLLYSLSSSNIDDARSYSRQKFAVLNEVVIVSAVHA